MAVNSGTTTVGKTTIATPQPIDASGNITPGATLTTLNWTISDASLVSLKQNTDSTATITGLKVGTCSITVNVQVVDSDGVTTQFTKTGTVIVSADPNDPRTVGIQIIFS